MSSSRKSECNNDPLLDTLRPDDFHYIMNIPKVLPNNLPVYSTALNRFTFLNKNKEDQEERKSYHLINTAKKDEKKFFIKYNEPNSMMSELELVCWMWYKMTARHIVPENVYACYDENFKFTGVASQEIPGFLSNHENPLQEEDLVIDVVERDFNYQRNCLINALQALSDCLDRSVDAEAGMTYSTYNYIRNSYNFWINPSPAAVQVKDHCEKFLKDGKFDDLSLRHLGAILAKRQEHIESKETEQYKVENKLLKESKKYIDNLTQLIKSQNQQLANIPLLELINQIVIKKNIIIDDLDHDKKICLILKNKRKKILTKDSKNICILLDREEKEELKNVLKGDAKETEILVNDIKNYRLIKGIAEGTVTSYINAENDYHSKNGSKLGERIDFDMSEWGFLSYFKPCNSLEWLYNGLKDNYILDLINWNKFANKNPFQFTEYDIRNFPNLKNANFRYWPTKVDLLSTSGLNTSSFFENFNTTENSAMFKKLTFHPVFIFHKYKTFLKNILVTEEMIRESAALCIRKNIIMPDSNKKIFDEFVSYKVNRLQELKQVLLASVEFQEFLKIHHSFVFEMIKEEFAEDIKAYRENMQMSHHSHEGKLVRAMDLNKLEQRFNEISIQIKPETLKRSQSRKSMI